MESTKSEHAAIPVHWRSNDSSKSVSICMFIPWHPHCTQIIVQWTFWLFGVDAEVIETPYDCRALDIDGSDRICIQYNWCIVTGARASAHEREGVHIRVVCTLKSWIPTWIDFLRRSGQFTRGFTRTIYGAVSWLTTRTCNGAIGTSIRFITKELSDIGDSTDTIRFCTFFADQSQKQSIYIHCNQCYYTSMDTGSRSKCMYWYRWRSHRNTPQ